MMECTEWLLKSNKGYEYLVSIVPKTRIRTKLGFIRKKNDDRWEWFRWSCKNGFHPTWNNGIRNSQGVVSTIGEAIKKLMEGWPENTRKTSDYYNFYLNPKKEL